MTTNLKKLVAIFTIAATITTGCRSSDEYKKIAISGDKYAEAVNQLLITAGDIRLEASSEQLLRNDRIINLSVADYNKLSQEDEKQLAILSKIREHNHLLKAYFAKLFELADSSAPKQAETEIEGITSNLNKIGQELRGSDLITNPSIFSGITNLVVSSQIRGSLRQELEQRKQTIMLELSIQQELLQALSKSIEQNTNLIKLAQEERFVIRPLIKPELIDSEDEWIETRRNILTKQRNAQQLKLASQTLGEFKTVFKDFVEGRMSIQKLNTFLKDVDSFLVIVESTKNK
jgi:hypothetical protein